jgi:EcsC protein family
VTPSLPPAAFADLQLAYDLLEHPGLAARLATLLGNPIEHLLDRLPEGVSQHIHKAAQGALDRALHAALKTISPEKPVPRHADRVHRLLTGATGALGGFFGLAGLAIELPVTTTLMLRSIAEIARREGEDLGEVEARLACVQVFAFGGGTRGGKSPGARVDDLGGLDVDPEAADTGYYAIRSLLAKTLSEAVEAVAGRGIARESSSVLVRYVARVASRFSVTVSEKVAAEALPVLGAASGAAINVLFTRHFQEMGRGHFIIRRLERDYGAPVVRDAYEALSS